MPAARKFSQEQWDYLISLVVEYNDHRAQKKKRIFFDNLESNWAKRFPEIEELKKSMPEIFTANAQVPSNDPAHLDKEDASGLPPFVWTPEIESHYNAAVRARNRQLVNWFTNHTKDIVGVGKTPDRVTDLEDSEGRKRAPQMIEVYQRMFKDKIRLAVEADRAERPLPPNYVLPPGTTKPPRDVLQAWRQTSRRTLIISMWAHESAENIEKVKAQCQREKELFVIEQAAVKITNAEAYGLERDPERRARFISGLVARLESLCQDVQRLCGWSAFMVVAGPHPSLNEKLMLHTVSAAYKDAAAPFPDTYRDYDEHIGDPITKWMKDIYRNHRTLRVDSPMNSLPASQEASTSAVATEPSSSEPSTSAVAPGPSPLASTLAQTADHREDHIVNPGETSRGWRVWNSDDDNLDGILGADQFSDLLTLGGDQFHESWNNFSFSPATQQQQPQSSIQFQNNWDVFTNNPANQWPEAPASLGGVRLPLTDQFTRTGMEMGRTDGDMLSVPILPASSSPLQSSSVWPSPLRSSPLQSSPLRSSPLRPQTNVPHGDGMLVQLAGLSSNLRRFRERYDDTMPAGQVRSAGSQRDYQRAGPSGTRSTPASSPYSFPIPSSSPGMLPESPTPLPRSTVSVQNRIGVIPPAPVHPSPLAQSRVPSLHMTRPQAGTPEPSRSGQPNHGTPPSLRMEAPLGRERGAQAPPAGPAHDVPPRLDQELAAVPVPPPVHASSPAVVSSVTTVTEGVLTPEEGSQTTHTPRITNFGGAFKQGKASVAAAKKAERQAATQEAANQQEGMDSAGRATQNGGTRGRGSGRGRGRGRGRGHGQVGTRDQTVGTHTEAGEGSSSAPTQGARPKPRPRQRTTSTPPDAHAEAEGSGSGQWMLYTDPNDPNAVIAPGPALRAHVDAMNKQTAPKRGQKRKAGANALNNPDGNHPLHVYCPPKGSQLNPMSAEEALAEIEGRRLSKRPRAPRKEWEW